MSLQPLLGPQTPMDFIIVIPSDVGGTFLNPEGLVLPTSRAWVSLGYLSVRPCFPGHAEFKAIGIGQVVYSKGLALTLHEPWCFHFPLPGWVTTEGLPSRKDLKKESLERSCLQPGLSLLVHRAFQRANLELSHTGRSELWELRPPVLGAGR